MFIKDSLEIVKQAGMLRATDFPFPPATLMRHRSRADGNDHASQSPA